MATLQLTDIGKSFGDQVVVDGVSLAVSDAEIVALLGPSGCGKTTVLRIVAGLEPEYEGSVALDGDDLRGVPPNERDFGLMFQDLALFPHMDVAGNVGFGLRMLGVPGPERAERVARLLELVGLPGKERRNVFDLSGGERQRVALARALAPEPALLMLDEPLAALDRNLRDALALEIRDVLKVVGVSGLYVTHDQEEALTIADRVAVMNAGRIEQVARPATLLREPASEFVARFLGYQNLVPLDNNDFIKLLAGLPGGSAPPASLVLVPEDAISPTPEGKLVARITTIQPRGRRLDVWALLEGFDLHLDLPAAVHADLQEGVELRLTIDQDLLHLIPHSPAIEP
ncbi:MAG: ABC transporter ATP-binding protein [Dehalococcoidia bacterium]